MRHFILIVPLFLAACGAHIDPPPPPALECVQVDFGSSCNDVRCTATMTCNRAPEPGEFGPEVACVSGETEGTYSCCTPSVVGGCDHIDK